jgi:hypothetical protein
MYHHRRDLRKPFLYNPERVTVQMCRLYGWGRAMLRARRAGSAANSAYEASSTVCVCARLRNVPCAFVRGFAPGGAAAVQGRCAGTELQQQRQQQSQLVLWPSGKGEGGRSRCRGVEPGELLIRSFIWLQGCAPRSGPRAPPRSARGRPRGRPGAARASALGQGTVQATAL